MSYGRLKADIARWVENASLELGEAIPTIIGFGELRCFRELPVRQFEWERIAAFNPGEPRVPIPIDMVAMLSFELLGPATVLPGSAGWYVNSTTVAINSSADSINSSGLVEEPIVLPGEAAVKLLDERNREFLRVYWPLESRLGVPKYYAVNDAGQFLVAPTPAEQWAYKLHYRRRLPALSTDNPENWLTTHAYDALLMACLVEAATFVLDDRQEGLSTLYEKRWQEKAAAVVMTEGRTRRDAVRTPAVMAANA